MEPLPARKKMLIPLNRPRITPAQELGLSVRISNLFIRTLIIVFKVGFGWLGWVLDRYYERKMSAEVRRELYFLFEDYDARFIPHKRSRYATTTVLEFGVVRLHIGRHHGDTAFSVASVFAPEQWEAFQLIVKGITRWTSNLAATSEFPVANDLTTFGPILKKSVDFLQEALSKDNVHSTLTKAIEAENASIDAFVETARRNGVEPVIHTSLQ